MGYSSQPENVLLLLSALSAVLAEMGYRHEAGAAEAAAHRAFAAQHVAAAGG
jgi:alanine-glyoxylate transaminase/serine-glyoxylate transaminase/serine-pyruvate transaminase